MGVAMNGAKPVCASELTPTLSYLPGTPTWAGRLAPGYSPRVLLNSPVGEGCDKSLRDKCNASHSTQPLSHVNDCQRETEAVKEKKITPCKGID